jgi:hypothetical protein
MEEELRNKISSLTKEVRELKKSYSETKQLAVEREKNRIYEIKFIYSKYYKNNRKENIHNQHLHH